MLPCLNCCECAAVSTGAECVAFELGVYLLFSFFEDIIFMCYFAAFMHYFYEVNLAVLGLGC